MHIKFIYLFFLSYVYCYCNIVDLKYGYIRGTKTDDIKNKVLTALNKFQTQATNELDRESFMYNSNGIYGMVWIGSRISNKDFADNIITVYQKEVSEQGMPLLSFLEYVNNDPNESIGIIITSDPTKWEEVKRAGKLWSMGKGYDKQDANNIKNNVKLCELDNRKTIKNDEANIGECIKFKFRNNEDVLKISGIDINSLNAYNPSVKNYVSNVNYCNSIGKINVEIKNVDYTYAWWTGTDNKQEVKKQAVLSALNMYSDWAIQFNSNRESFKFQNSEIIGFMWIGQKVDTKTFIDNFIKTFKDEVNSSGFPNLAYMEYITGDPMSSCGIVFDTNPTKLDNVARADKLWSQGSSFNFMKGSKKYSNKLGFLSSEDKKVYNNDEEVGECLYNTIEYTGQTVTEICNIAQENLVNYNKNIVLNNLPQYYPVCCSIGKRPDLKPKMNSDGSCYNYTLVAGDTCDNIAAKFYPLKISDINNYNRNNPDWYSCYDILYDNIICLSEGTL